MPIYEFKCMKCNEYFERLIMNDDEKLELKCPKCEGPEIERVLSKTSYSMGGDAGAGASARTRTCSSGSCTTYDIPGPKG